jgi:hypothetical protein
VQRRWLFTLGKDVVRTKGVRCAQKTVGEKLLLMYLFGELRHRDLMGDGEVVGVDSGRALILVLLNH